MGEIRFVGTGETRGYPYLVCKKKFVGTGETRRYPYPVCKKNISLWGGGGRGRFCPFTILAVLGTVLFLSIEKKERLYMLYMLAVYTLRRSFNIYHTSAAKLKKKHVSGS